MEKSLNHLNQESGQALIEFSLSLMILFSFFFFFIRLCAVFAAGNLIHYATFMSARAYLSSRENTDQQEEAARRAFTGIVGSRVFPGLLKKQGEGLSIGPGPSFEPNLSHSVWDQGSEYRFSAKLSLYPWSRQAGDLEIKLISESRLNRERTTQEVLQDQKKIEEIAQTKVEWDNGI